MRSRKCFSPYFYLFWVLLGIPSGFLSQGFAAELRLSQINSPSPIDQRLGEEFQDDAGLGRSSSTQLIANPGLESQVVARWRQVQDQVNSPLSIEARERLSSVIPILVPGFGNEFVYLSILFDYFAGAEAALIELGMITPRYFDSKSHLSRNNSESYYKLICELNEKEGKRAFPFFHSKAAHEGLVMIYNHPELFLEGKLDRVVFLQGAIQGSRLLDNPTWINWLAKNTVYHLIEGIRFLHPRAAKKNLDEAYENFNNKIRAYAESTGLDPEEVRNEIHNRVFYARTYMEPKHFTLISRTVQFLCGGFQQGHEHDGLLHLEDQFDPRLGIPLDSPGEHTHHVLTPALDASNPNSRAFRFVEALVNSISQYCEVVGIKFPSKDILQYVSYAGDTITKTMGAYDLNTQKSYFRKLCRCIYDPHCTETPDENISITIRE